MLPVLLLSLLGCAAALPLPAAAWQTPPAHPEYSISVVEGESTQPERFPVAMTDGQVEPAAPTVISIIHDGIVVAQDTDPQGNVYLDQVPLVGDVVTLQSPPGTLLASVVYDGMPTMDPTVCAGSTDFSGQRSPGFRIEGGYYLLVPHPSYVAQRASSPAQVNLLSGSAFGGYFLVPPTFGDTVWASESSQTALAGGAVFSYSSENVRPVGACPQPPPPFHPPAPPILLGGSIVKLGRIDIANLLKHGWLDLVTINQPGSVIQGLYRDGGRLPAFVSRVRAHKQSPPALLLARGVAKTAKGGEVSVLLRVTSQGRRWLRHVGHAQAQLLTTLRGDSGTRTDLRGRVVSLHR